LAPLERRDHASPGTVSFLLVIKLGHCRQHVLREPTHRIIRDRLVHRSKGNTETHEQCPDNRVIVRVPGKPCDVENDHELDSAFVQPAVLQQKLECWSVSRLRGFASILEDLRDVESVTIAVGAAGLELRAQRQIEGLLLGRHASIDYGPHSALRRGRLFDAR
jgi:hypothetical protein